MTTARHELDRVLVSLPADWVRQSDLIRALDDARSARLELDGVIGQARFTNAVIQPLRKKSDEAQAEVQRLLTESLSIEDAEVLYGYLGGAIVHAKVWRGDFNKGDQD